CCVVVRVFCLFFFFFFQAEDGIRDRNVTGVQTCALPIFAMPASVALLPRPSRFSFSYPSALVSPLTALWRYLVPSCSCSFCTWLLFPSRRLAQTLSTS